jgi:hypothetical protein
MDAVESMVGNRPTLALPRVANVLGKPSCGVGQSGVMSELMGLIEAKLSESF